MIFVQVTLNVAAQREVPPALREQLVLLEEYVSIFRPLDEADEISVSFLSREEAAAQFERLFYEEYPPERLATLYLFYRALDLAEPGLDLGTLYLDYLKSVIAGYYDPDNESMTIILPADRLGDALPLSQELTYIHEYIHALQDQHFDLSALMEANSSNDNPDGWLALSALVEGDATYMTMLLLRLLLTDDYETIPRELSSEAETPAPPPDDLPHILLSEIDFIYWEGQRFVESIIEARGWEGVNRAFRTNPPQTSEQILHPDRYLQGQGSIRIEIPNLASSIGEGWQIGFEGTAGEFYLLKHLETQVDAPHSVRYANGWGGDMLRIYMDEEHDETMWIWHQVWDRPNDAEQFFDGYTYFLDKRYYGRYQRERADEQCWVGAKSSHCFARINEIETRISMAPDQATARQLLAMAT
jgi:hypothetical protein